MADKTEYIFEKDFWGNWKLVPKKQDSGIGWLIVLLIVVVIVCLAIITLPLWIALLGFKMVKTKRYYAGIGSLLALLYFIIDIQNRWITGFLFLGYNDSAGKFTEGLIGEKQIMYVYVANGIGVLLGLYFIVQAYLLNKENNALNNSTSGNETSSETSQSSTDYSISSSKPKSSSYQLNLVLGILGAVFAIAVIYFSFNKNALNDNTGASNVINQSPKPLQSSDETIITTINNEPASKEEENVTETNNEDVGENIDENEPINNGADNIKNLSLIKDKWEFHFAGEITGGGLPVYAIFIREGNKIYGKYKWCTINKALSTEGIIKPDNSFSCVDSVGNTFSGFLKNNSMNGELVSSNKVYKNQIKLTATVEIDKTNYIDDLINTERNCLHD